MGKRHYLARPERPRASDGCKEARTCFACPLPACRYDLPGGAHGLRVAERRAELLRLHDLGVEPSEIARRLGLQAATVRRIVTGLRQERVGAGETTR